MGRSGREQRWVLKRSQEEAVIIVTLLSGIVTLSGGRCKARRGRWMAITAVVLGASWLLFVMIVVAMSSNAVD